MRLTLRTLLAYLDDALDPALTRQIGEKVAESDTARELIERIKWVTRRRRLTTPEMTGDPDVAVDPNLVADYLDNVIPEEKIGELEKLCLESDVNLAEVAACHQILAVIPGEPTQAPPTSYERMYGLVAGAEAIPHQRALHGVVRDREVAVDTHDEADEPLLMGMSKPAGLKRWFVAALAAMLLVGLFGVLYFAFSDREATPRLARYAPWQEDPTPAPERIAVPPIRVADDLALLAPASPMWAGWLGTPSRPVPEQASLSAASVSLAAGWLAARPGMLGNWFLIFGRTEGLSADLPPPIIEPVKPAFAVPLKASPPSTALLRIGIHASQSTRDSLLFRRQGAEDWRSARPAVAIQTNEPLLTLPGYRSEIALDNQMRVELIGSLPLTMPNYHLEALAAFHASADADLDVTLLRGRMVISNRPAGDALIRLRFVDQVWEVRLAQPKSEIGVELAGLIPPGAGEWVPHYRINLFTRGGDVEIRREGKSYRVPALRQVPWDNSGRAAADTQVLLPDAPNWMTKKIAVPEDVRAATTRFASRLTDKLKVGGSDVAWIKVACQESLGENKPWERGLGVFCLGAVDQIETLVKELDADVRSEIRVRALDTLFHWLGRQPDQDKPLAAALGKRGFTADEQDTMMLVLRGFKFADRPVIESLIGNLSSPRLAIRELSYYNLHLLLQMQAEKLAGFDPAGPVEARDAAIRSIRARVLGKS